MTGEQEQRLWVALAELFFLDTEPQDHDFDRVARLLEEANWTPDHTRKTLIELIAPVAGHNLGFLIYPVIGEWAGFDEAKLCKQIQRISDSRSRRPAWCFLLSDWYCEWMLRKLDMDRLLALLADRRAGVSEGVTNSR
jgi:hypothetical protein